MSPINWATVTAKMLKGCFVIAGSALLLSAIFYIFILLTDGQTKIAYRVAAMLTLRAAFGFFLAGLAGKILAAWLFAPSSVEREASELRKQSESE